MESDRIYALTSRLFEYVKSPSLKHTRDPHSVQRLAHELLMAVDCASSIWKKWDGQREEVAKSAAHCWIPIEDLQTYLNSLPGPPLTRLLPALYAAEKAEGTEMPAIIGALQEHIEAQEDQLRREHEEAVRRHQTAERLRKQQLFEAGADSGWLQLEVVEGLHCRRNGRTYRAVQGKDKRWSLFRMKVARKCRRATRDVPEPARREQSAREDRIQP